MKISPARVAAFEILNRIDQRGEFSSNLLAESESKLGAADRAMCHATVLGVLRSKLRLYRTIDILADGKKIDPEIRTILAMSLYQMTELDRVPARAIVYDAVSLAIHARKKSAKGFVNALLRKFQTAAPMPDYEDEMERLSIETSHPDWLLRRWITNYGEERARELAVFNNQPAANDYRFTCRTTAADRTAIECVEPSLRPHLLRELADSGKIYFQDRGFAVGRVGDQAEARSAIARRLRGAGRKGNPRRI